MKKKQCLPKDWNKLNGEEFTLGKDSPDLKFWVDRVNEAFKSEDKWGREFAVRCLLDYLEQFINNII